MADDIQIKLGVDIGKLFIELQKAINQLNSLIGVAQRAEVSIEQIDGQKVTLDTTPAQNSLNELEQEAEKTSKKVADDVNENLGKAGGASSGIMAGFVGGLTSAGVGAAIEGVKSLGSAIYQGALNADDFGDKLEVAFSQQGIADVEGEINKVRESTLNLANSLGLPVERTRELAGTVATLGGVSGKQAEELTKLSAGIETFTDGTVKGEAVVKAFSRGLADPEGAAAIESLSKKYPQLADTLKSNIDPAQKLAEANKILGTSFETVAAQQGDAGGALNTLSNFATEAFENIGSTLYDIINEVLPIFMDGFKEISTVFDDVFGSTEGSTINFLAIIKEVAQIVTDVLVAAFVNLMNIIGPIINFIVSNFSTIAPIIGIAAGAFAAYNLVVGIGTAVTAAYGAVQTALGGSISIATAAQYAWNLAMSLNPIGAVVAGLAVLAAGVYAVSDALSISAEEARETAEANVEMIKTQKESNEEQTKAVQSTKTMADEYLSLSKKKKLTADETKKLQGLTKDLSAEYPDLVKNTGNYKDNLDGVESIANRAGTSLQGLAKESDRLDKALQKANQTLAYSKRNEALDEAASQMKTLGVVTDSYGLKAVNAFSKALYAAQTQEQAADAYATAIANISNVDAQTAVTTAYNSQIAAMNAFKKTADTVIDTNKKLTDSTKPPGGKGDTPAGTAPPSEYKNALTLYQAYLKGIEIYRKEQVKKFEAEGLNKEEIQLKLAADPNAAPTAAAVSDQIMKSFKATRDAQGNLQIGVKLGKDEDKAEALLNVRSLLADADKFEVKLKTSFQKPNFKDAFAEFEILTKDIEKNVDALIPVSFATTQETLDLNSQQIQKYLDFIKSQNAEIEQAKTEALLAGNTQVAESLDAQIKRNILSFNTLEGKLKQYQKGSAEEIKKNTTEYQIQLAIQTSIFDAFNSDKLQKEREANEAIRAEKLGALDQEETDLTTSLAKREVSFEEYAAKMADIDKARQDAMEATETTFAERLKEVQDKTIGSLLRSQSAAITGFVTDQFKDSEGKVTANGKIIGESMTSLTTQFAALAESGKATLGDFGNAAAAVAFDAVSKMIPSFVAGILGSSITALGPIAGPIAAGLLTASLQLLLGQAKAALGFKDGVVDLAGPGTETSDSIPAWLSKGESVITASSTRANKEELAWMNNNPGMSIRDYFTSHAPQVRYSVDEDGGLIREVQKLREETRGLGRQINRNTHVSISGELRADNNSIKAVIDNERRRNARRG